MGRVLQDRDGVVWVTFFLPRLSNWFLCSVTSDRTECHGLDGGAGIGSIGIFEGTNGQLWVATGDGVWRWKPGPARFYSFGKQLDGFLGLAEDARGALLISRPGRVERLIDGRLETLFRFPSGMSETRFLKMFSDRDGALWLYGSASGLLHFHQGVTDVFSEADGLSSDIVSVVFEDREGSVWVATVEGLHRFRDVAVATVSTRQGLPSPRANALAASPDGSVWIATLGGLTKMRDGKTIVYRERSALPAAVQSVFRDSRGRIWASTELGVGYLEHDRFVKVDGVPGGVTRSITEDGDGTIWIANQAEGLLALPQGDQPRAAIAWASLGHAEAASAVVGDPRRAGVWLGFGLGGLVYFGGKATTTYSPADGLAPGRISHLHFDRAGTLWIATEGGLTRLKDGRLATLNPASGLPCDTVQWALADDAESLWLGMACGLVRISSGEITAWASAADRRHTPRGVLSTVFGSADGFRFLTGTPYSVPVVKSMDGRLWFRSLVGVNVLDPGSLPFNRLPPPVHVEHVIADRKTYDVVSSGAGGLRLPSLTRDLQIDFTALSLVAPEKIRFRYRLEGRDATGRTPGRAGRRSTPICSPGSYRFRVIASNNDGVWNETGATVDFADRTRVLPDHLVHGARRRRAADSGVDRPPRPPSHRRDSISARSSRSTSG